MSKIVVTGAYGWVGSSVCEWLEIHGHSVLRLDLRVGDRGGLSWNCCENPTNEVCSAMAAASAVIHCAGHVHHPVETEKEKVLFFDINSGGTERLLRVCEQYGPKRFIFVSTVALYSWDGLKACTEESKVNCLSAYAESKYKAERLILTSNLDWRIARLSTVFGHGDRANLLKLAKAIQKRRFFIPGKGTSRKSVISITRAAELLGRLALIDAPAHRLVNLGVPEAPDLAEICDAFSSTCGFPRALRLPISFSRVVALLGDGISIISPTFPFNSKVLSKLTTDTVVDITKQQELFSDLVWRKFKEDLAGCADFYRC